MTILKDKIKNLRKAKKITQKELANYLNVSTSTISRYEKGKRNVSIEILEDIASFFDVSVLYFLDIELEESAMQLKEHGELITDVEIEIIKELRKYKELYYKLISDHVRVIRVISKRLK